MICLTKYPNRACRSIAHFAQKPAQEMHNTRADRLASTRHNVLPMLSKNLERLRVHHKYKQKVVADHLGVHETTYGRYESGAIVPSEDQQTLLAEFYNVPLDVLRSAGDITLHLTNAHGTQVGNGHNETHQINVVSEEFVKQILETIHAQQSAVLKDVRSLVSSVVQTNERLTQLVEQMMKTDRKK